MDEAKEPSFTSLVFGKAYYNTKLLFADKVKDAIFGVLLLAVGGAFSWHWHGLPVAMESAIYFIATSLWPIGLVVSVVFLWNLWLAPAELAYENYRITQKSEAPTQTLTPAVNWVPWRQMPKFSLLQFAKILAKDDPAKTRESSEAVAFAQLVWIAVNDKSLAYLLRRVRNEWDNGFHTEELCFESEVSRNDAISWAKTKGFDISHIE